MKTQLLRAATAAALLAPCPLAAQDMGDHMAHRRDQPAPPAAESDAALMPMQMQMDHGAMDHSGTAGMSGIAGGPGEGSGTSRLPAAEGGMHGLMVRAGDWHLMVHGYLWGAYTAASGPRGDDLAFVESMAMLRADRDIGGAHLSLRSMFSLEPAMGARGYPNLFATGEAANGKALVDRQHPHDLFMELAARVDVPIGGGLNGFVYGGPVGEPALGPSAFMHRGSARNLPLAPITHHWFDSTHISYGVVTAGVSSSVAQVEASAFRGREPDERRWGIETPKLDSWSVRATLDPTDRVSAQVSYGRLHSPEELHPGDDEGRFTASAHYATDRLTTTIAFSAKNRIPGPTLTAFLAEANYQLTARHSVFGRVENVANDELFVDEDDPLHDVKFRVTRFEGGYAYRIPLASALGLSLGGSLATYAKPDALDVAYGKAPVQATLFAKLSLGH